MSVLGVDRSQEIHLIQVHELTESSGLDCYTSWWPREETDFSEDLLYLEVSDEGLRAFLHDNQLALDDKEHALASLRTVRCFVFFEVEVLTMFKLFSFLKFVFYVTLLNDVVI